METKSAGAAGEKRPNHRAREKYQSIVVGRREDLAHLWELASKGRHVIVTGAPGVGKSALLEMFFQSVSAQEDVYIFRVADGRQFKNALVELAGQMHARGIYEHPRYSENVLRSISPQKLAPKIRSLLIKDLAQSLVLSLSGREAILIWDQFDRATPTELSWLHQFLDRATVILGTCHPFNSKLKVILNRVPAKIELQNLTEAETHELIDGCFEIAPFGVSDPAWYRREVWRKSGGNPRAVKDLLADHSLEKYVDSEMIRSMQNEQAVRYFAISWFVYVFILAFAIYRYVGRGLGDRDSYIIGAVGMVVFWFLAILVKRANRAS